MIDDFLGFFIPLVFAHLLTDFVFQTDVTARAKNKLPVLIGHGLIAGILSYLFVGRLPGWEIPTGVTLSHVLLDAWKFRVQSKSKLRKFVMDQLGYLIILVLFSWAAVIKYGGYPGLWTLLLGKNYLVVMAVISGGIVSIYVGSFIVEFTFVTLGIKNRPILEDPSGRGETGIAEGGRIIGYLERALIYLFVLVGYPAGLGFLIAAKSVFRFGELTDSKRRWQAEYIIIGTLLSVLFGTVTAYLTAAVIRLLVS